MSAALIWHGTHVASNPGSLSWGGGGEGHMSCCCILSVMCILVVTPFHIIIALYIANPGN